MSKAISIAKEFLRQSYTDAVEIDPVSNLRLHKLLYYAQAWSMVLRERDLFEEDFQAWRHGPVIPAVYQRLKSAAADGSVVIPEHWLDEVPDPLPDEADFVRAVWDSYKSYSAIGLANKTHEEAPWKNVWGSRPASDLGSDVIPVGAIEEYFTVLEAPPPLAQYRRNWLEANARAEMDLAARTPLDAGRLLAAIQNRSPV